MAPVRSPDHGLSFEISRRELERARDELLSGNPHDPRLDLLRPVVRESWRRSAETLTAGDGVPVLELPGTALESYRREHLLAGVIDAIHALLLPGTSEDSGVAVAVGDADGRLLWIRGDRDVRRRTEGLGFVEGTNWSERIVGTAGVGTSLVLGDGVHITGAEHLNPLMQPWSCSAVTLRDPETRAVMGLLDVTGVPDSVTAHSQLLVRATARAVENELLVMRLKQRAAASAQRNPARRRTTPRAGRVVLQVLGRERALLEIAGESEERMIELSRRHAEILLLLSAHEQGLTARRLSELVYGDPGAVDTLRPELVRLRKVLEPISPRLVLHSRPYRLSSRLETDAQRVRALLDRGAHRAALAAHREILPGSTAPGVEELRDGLRAALREALLADAGIDALLAFADTPAAVDDEEVLRLCLTLLPPQSPRRAGLVARLMRLEQDA